MKIELYGLLYLDEGELSAVNVSVSDFKDQIEVYMNCAINLSNSLKSNRHLFHYFITIITGC
jgi:hypothetical protein